MTYKELKRKLIEDLKKEIYTIVKEEIKYAVSLLNESNKNTSIHTLPVNEKKKYDNTLKQKENIRKVLEKTMLSEYNINENNESVITDINGNPMSEKEINLLNSLTKKDYSKTLKKMGL